MACRPSSWQSRCAGRIWKKVGGVATATLLGQQMNTWKLVMEDQFISGRLRHPFWGNPSISLLIFLSQSKNNFFAVICFVMTSRDEDWHGLRVFKSVEACFSRSLCKTWNTFSVTIRWDYTSINILNEFRFVLVWTGSHKGGKLSEERISECEWALSVDWGTAAYMGWGRRMAACWAHRTDPGPWLQGGRWETIALQWWGALPDTSVRCVATLEAFKPTGCPHTT